MTGEQFKKYRVKAGFTQRRLGEMLGYEGKSAEVVIQLWEYGKQPIPLKHFRALSKLLNVPLEAFIP